MVDNGEGKSWKEMPTMRDGEEDCPMNGMRQFPAAS